MPSRLHWVRGWYEIGKDHHKQQANSKERLGVTYMIVESLPSMHEV